MSLLGPQILEMEFFNLKSFSLEVAYDFITKSPINIINVFTENNQVV